VLPLLLLTLTGCLQASPAQKSQHTRSLERWFPDPGAQALAVAAELGDAAEVRRLMKDEGVNPDKHFSPEGMPLVAWPIYTKNPAGLKAMLENGADPNAAKNYPLPPDRTPRNYDNALVRAAKEEDSVYLKLLLDHNGNPDTRNVNNESLLFQAMIWGNQSQNVMLLVERGADVNKPHAGMAAPILEHYATRGAFKTTLWLMEHGADPRLEYHGGLAKPPFSMQKDSRTIEAIFWMPTKDQAFEWQTKCQHWLMSHGYQRPPMPEQHRKTRADFGFPTEEKDIPLPNTSKEATL
jgi:uncharacterized protein